MKKISIKSNTKDGGHYSAGVAYNGLLYISGQLSVNPETGKRENNIKDETLQALKNLDRVLIASGSTRDDVIQCRIYTPSVSYWPEINKVYADFFGDHKPSRVVVPCNTLHGGCLVEIEAIAIYKEEK
ncbi:MAG: RidA family protein [Firmicutes bacterium]|jgi:reactive intermediate/imine deaminase|nr:RidA family protein [Bacillota bacterium]